MTGTAGRGGFYGFTAVEALQRIGAATAGLRVRIEATGGRPPAELLCYLDADGDEHAVRDRRGGCVMGECVEVELGGCVGPVGLYVALSGSRQRFPRCEGHYQAYQERMAGVNAGIAVRYPHDPPAGWSPMDAGEAWHAEDY